MDQVVVDFETYWATDYTLSKMTTEEYVRDPRFEVILCGFKVNDEPAYWVDRADVAAELARLDLERNIAIAHHAHFDGLILSHHYGVIPRFWLDTLSMSRAVDGTKASKKLGDLAKKHDLPDKGTEILNTFGKRRADFTSIELKRYGEYCCNDCDIEYGLAQVFLPWFDETELRLMDATVRMFTEPVLWLHTPRLQRYLADMKYQKADLMMRAGVQLPDLRSNEKFANVLRSRGVDPPMKFSKPRKDGSIEQIYAFAKTDEGMQDLLEHEDEAIQVLAAARIGAKSTINESRAQRLIDMQGRGAACVYLKYYGAGVTGRASGGDKMNWQNFTRGGFLRDSVCAPDGHELVVGDSSNIEARILDWLAGQEDMIEAYRLYDAGKGPDIYCVQAEKIYGRVISKKDHPLERQMGKVAKLGLGFGMGPPKFVFAVRAQAKDAEGKPLVIDEVEARRVVTIYRSTHKRVVGFWYRCDDALEMIARGTVGVRVDYRGIITTCENGLRLPNGLVIKYTDLKKDEHGQWTYWDGRARQHIFGAKVVENIVQALARIVVMTQTMAVQRRLVLSVHDEGVWCVPIPEVESAVKEVRREFRRPLDWCADLPLNCGVGHHRVYGRAKT